jgi:hypothetical protein
MAGFLFRLELADDAPAEPASFSAAVPDWPDGSMIHLGKRALRVIGRQDDDSNQPPVLIVEDGQTSGFRAETGTSFRPVEMVKSGSGRTAVPTASGQGRSRRTPNGKT